MTEKTKLLQRVALIAGVIAAALAVGGLVLAGEPVFFRYYLVAYLFWFELTMGGLILAMLHYLTGGNWGFAIRRVLEGASKTIWLMALLFIPLLFGLDDLYAWARPEVVAENPLLQHKDPYLNVPFFLVRTGVYFAIWLGIVFLLTRWSPDPAYTFGPRRRRRFQRAAAISIVVVSLTMTFASIDWLMSLQPEWLSTSYGLLIISGQALAGLAFAILMVTAGSKGQPIESFLGPRVFRDLGALLLTTVLLWAYIAFTQFLIIWSGNIPREITWYLVRSEGGWLGVGVFVVVLQFVLPFLVLLSLRAKRSPLVLAVLSGAVLVTRLVYYYWEVIPVFSPAGVSLHWILIPILIAIGGLWLATFFFHFERTPLVLPEAEAGEAAVSHV